MSEVKASLDGKIREIKVRVGDAVRQNQEILTIETPRLSTIILSTETGIIEKLDVESGETVKAGQIMLWIRKDQ